jgi:hypothetical protein
MKLSRRRLLPGSVLAVLALGTTATHAADFSVSGFGTVGYSRSNQSFAYQRFVDDHGTFKHDSVFGIQLDAKLTPQWGITVQGKMAPAADSDHGWEATLPWAFVSWRPSNDWLFRLGRYRVPSYLNAENIDVGQTFDFARLPYEVYSTTPAADFDGASFTKTWESGINEFSLDGYVGRASKTHWRFFRRDTIPGVQEAGAYYWPLRLDSAGLTLTLQREENTYRAGFYKAYAKPDLPFPANFPYVGIAPGIGYYQTSDRLPGPGVPTTEKLDISVYYLATDLALGGGYRFAGEYVRRAVRNTDLGPDTQSAYVSLRKRFGNWTPYVIHARLHSESRPLDMFKALDNSMMPGFVPGAALINASQRAGADGIIAYDQYSSSLGVSYAVSSTSKIKADWTRVHVGSTSSLVDRPAVGDVRGKDIDIVSLSYSFVF